MMPGSLTIQDSHGQLHAADYAAELVLSPSGPKRLRARRLGELQLQDTT